MRVYAHNQVVPASCPWGWPGAQRGYACAPFNAGGRVTLLEKEKMQDLKNTGWSQVLGEPSTAWLAEFSLHSQPALSLQLPPLPTIFSPHATTPQAVRVFLQPHVLLKAWIVFPDTKSMGVTQATLPGSFLICPPGVSDNNLSFPNLLPSSSLE